ncbi:MAG: helix-turn-helix transcriptional regulator [Bacteroidetes bacterium]|nr:helix-turn-helix transcriptional regulator [Bacteroidota bacterium]
MLNKAKVQQTLPKLAEKLKQARKQKGLTQGQLAKKIGADIQRISKYERCILIPTTPIMVKLSNALDVSLDYLLKNDKNRVTGKVKDTELIDQFIQVDALPDQDRHILKALLEAFIKKYQFETLAMK